MSLDTELDAPIDVDSADVDTESATARDGFVLDDPKATGAWASSSAGQQRLALHLNWALHDDASVLHDRKLAGSRGIIDHIVVGPTGIWVVDARSTLGSVEARSVVRDGVTSNRLFVSGNEATEIADDIDWQVGAVRRALEPIGFGGAPVSSAICFTDADWAFFAKPFQVNGVWITWAKRLTETVLSQRMFSNEAIEIVSTQLAAQLLPAN